MRGSKPRALPLGYTPIDLSAIILDFVVDRSFVMPATNAARQLSLSAWRIGPGYSFQAYYNNTPFECGLWGYRLALMVSPVDASQAI